MHSYLDGAHDDPILADGSPVATAETVRPIRDLVASANAALAIENTFDARFADFVRIVDELDVGAVLDPHRLELAGVSVREWIERLGDRTVGMHAYGTSGDDGHVGIDDTEAESISRISQRIGAAELLLDVPRASLSTSAAHLDRWLG